MLLPASGGDQQPYLSSAAVEFTARVSPDGRWLAYASNESGRLEIFLQTFPTPGRKMQVSTEGGTQPVWARDGRELYYRSGQGLMAARITPGERLLVDTPVVLFKDTFLRPQGDAHTTFDVFPDGSFLFIEGTESNVGPATVTAAFNWAEEMKRALQAARK